MQNLRMKTDDKVARDLSLKWGQRHGHRRRASSDVAVPHRTGRRGVHGIGVGHAENSSRATGHDAAQQRRDKVALRARLSRPISVLQHHHDGASREALR